MRAVGVMQKNRVTKLQRKLPFGTYFSIRVFKPVCLISALLFSNLYLLPTVWSENHFEPPFWPEFPTALSVVPTHVTFQDTGSAINQSSDPFHSDLKVMGEGRGFLVLATSVDHVVFATVPRMDLAWKVACSDEDCDIRPATKNAVDQKESPAYQAAMMFAKSRNKSKPQPSASAVKEPKKQTEKQKTATSKLPPISILMGSRKHGSSSTLQPVPQHYPDTGGTLLQGFK